MAIPIQVQIPIALDMAKDLKGNAAALQKNINADENMRWAVKECYESSKHVLKSIIIGEHEKRYEHLIILQE